MGERLAGEAGAPLRVNDRLSVRLPDLPDQTLLPENIALSILYEDEHLVAIDKPAGMIVHPGKGNYRGTLAAALQFHFDQLSDVSGRYRAGIVHRLDRDTSGVVVIAKNNQVHYHISAQFERREVMKEYRALVWGNVSLDSDYVETHLRVHPRTREKMMVSPAGGNARHAVTYYEVLKRFGRFTYLRLLPKTGRTHQLRVHMQYLGHPIVADKVYGGQSALLVRDVTEGREPDATSVGNESPGETVLIARQALHALRLEIRHPQSGQPLAFEAPLPVDFRSTLDACEPAPRIGVGRSLPRRSRSFEPLIPFILRFILGRAAHATGEDSVGQR